MVLDSLDDTRELARQLVAATSPGSLLLLSGPLGAGKTTLTACIVRELGSEAAVSSPTYTLVHEYPTPEGPLVHIDAYRLGHPAALDALGLDDYLDRSRLVVVEWGEALAHDYPEAWLVRLERDGETRRVELQPPKTRE
ncbi:MAG TPA: tRNA (adenosine(37)-N6)-threonylcarbamoyltransferase complex ATPase subunit type 1 TsaE [Trueperaceae bacterium]